MACLMSFHPYPKELPVPCLKMLMDTIGLVPGDRDCGNIYRKESKAQAKVGCNITCTMMKQEVRKAFFSAYSKTRQSAADLPKCQSRCNPPDPERFHKYDWCITDERKDKAL
jgi:hypothetical protein